MRCDARSRCTTVGVLGLTGLLLASTSGCARTTIQVDGQTLPTRPRLELVRETAGLRWRTVAPGTSSGPDPGAPAPSEDEVRERLALVERTLRTEGVPSARFRWGWTLAFGALVAFNVGRAVFTSNESARDAGIVGAAGSALGLGSALLMPPRGMYAAGEFAVYRARSRDPQLRQLREGERLWRQVAEAEEFNRSWLSQLGRGLIATTLGLILAVGLNHPDQSGLNIGAGLIIGQLTVRTFPLGAYQAWQRYSTRYPDAGLPVRRFSGFELSAAPMPNGVTVGVTF